MRRHGQTSAEDAGIPVGDTPSPLCRLLVLSLLLSAWISAGIGAAARELSSVGWRTPMSMQDATWQQRVDALGWSGHRRYDKRTSTQLGELADTVLDRYRGDPRRCTGPTSTPRRRSPPGSARSGWPSSGARVQAVWTDLAPYVNDIAADGPQALDLPRTGDRLAALVTPADLPE